MFGSLVQYLVDGGRHDMKARAWQSEILGSNSDSDSKFVSFNEEVTSNFFDPKPLHGERRQPTLPE